LAEKEDGNLTFELCSLATEGTPPFCRICNLAERKNLEFAISTAETSYFSKFRKISQNCVAVQK
jgi:hypothetical protein